MVWEVLDHDEIYAHPEEVCYIVMLQRSDGSQPAMNRTVTNVTLMENKTVVSCNCTVYVGTMNEPHLFIKSRCYIVLLTVLDMLEPIPDLIICGGMTDRWRPFHACTKSSRVAGHVVGVATSDQK